MRVVFDIETTGFLDHTSVDYTASPYKLLPSYKLHCIAVKDIDTEEIYTFSEAECYTKFPRFSKQFTMLIGANIINFDLLVLKLALGLNYTVGDIDTFNGKEVIIYDTMVASKVLNPDRYGGHSIEAWGKTLGLEKIDWRAKAIECGYITKDSPPGAEFAQYSPEMLEYNIRDVEVNHKVYNALVKEWGDWPWQDAFKLEQKVAEIITRQQHRGFWFDADKAVEHIKDLDERMAKLKAIVEPLIPPKLLTKGAAKEFIPPKIQFKKDGTLSANIQKWVTKHNGKIRNLSDEETGYSAYEVVLYGKIYAMPIPQEPLITHEPATIKDTTHIKGWMVGELGWEPSAYKERDLTVDSKKHKLSLEKYVDAVERYITQTMSSPFKKDRLEHLEVYSEEYLRKKLLKHDHIKRPMKVLTNPTLTVGMEKEIDPNLLLLNDKFAHAKDISDYLTYSHRRNSILGGGADADEWDDEDEDAEIGKGWLAVPRIQQDHRIPTPADTCGAGTSRFKHRLVANVPRVTSPFGKELRELFGVDVENGFFQFGYDFASLEAMIESHYCWRYDEDKEYCNSLVLEKPNDVHTKTAEKISQVLGREFKRTPSKNVKYCCAYGGQPKRVAKTIGCSLDDGKLVFDAYWMSAQPLAKLADKLRTYWETTGNKKFIIGLDGRKIPTRSASALINSLFQSAGVICAKRAMVIHDQLIKANNLSVDFWLDGWKNISFAQQLIGYHDEAQFEVHKSLIKWKLFKTEEEAKEFRKVNPTWSEIGHNGKGYYLGYCLAGELIQKAVKETSKYYKLNVTLSADYILGRNWAECH